MLLCLFANRIKYLYIRTQSQLICLTFVLWFDIWRYRNSIWTQNDNQIFIRNFSICHHKNIEMLILQIALLTNCGRMKWTEFNIVNVFRNEIIILFHKLRWIWKCCNYCQCTRLQHIYGHFVSGSTGQSVSFIPFFMDFHVHAQHFQIALNWMKVRRPSKCEQFIRWMWAASWIIDGKIGARAVFHASHFNYMGWMKKIKTQWKISKIGIYVNGEDNVKSALLYWGWIEYWLERWAITSKRDNDKDSFNELFSSTAQMT